MADSNDLIPRLRAHGVKLHHDGVSARAQLIGRTIEALLADEPPSLRRSIASELKLFARAPIDPPTRILLQDALSELEKPRQ